MMSYNSYVTGLVTTNKIQLIGSETQRFRDSEIQRFRDSEIPRFRDSEIQRFGDSEIQRQTHASDTKGPVWTW